MSLWKHIHASPPAMVRLMARRKVAPGSKHVRAMSIEEIAILAGMPLDRAVSIANSLTWDHVTIPEAERFMAACGFDPLNPKDRNRKKAYERICSKRPPERRFAYLRKSPWWDREFKPLISRLQSQRAS